MSQMQNLLDEVREMVHALWLEIDTMQYGSTNATRLRKYERGRVADKLTRILAKYKSQPESESGKWVFVAGRLPEEDKNVLVGNTDPDSGQVGDAYYHNNTFWDTVEGVFKYDVTHWQPLSLPPDNNQHGRKMAGTEIESAQDTLGESAKKRAVYEAEQEVDDE